MATNVIFTRGNTATINATAITDGQILYNTTTGTQYLDNGTTRLQIGQNITVDATLNSSSNNPIANSGVAGVMHTSLSEISTITQAGNIPDALAVKELNSNMSLIKTYVGTDGKLHSVDATGADSVLPFSSVTKYDKLFSKGLTLVTGDWIPKAVSGTGSYARMENNSLVIYQSSGAGTSAYISTPTAIDLSSYDYVEFKINTYTLTGSQSASGTVDFGVKSAISDSTGETFSDNNWLKKIQKTKAQMTSAGNKFIVDVTGISSGYITFGTWYVTSTDVVCSVEEVAIVKV